MAEVVPTGWGLDNIVCSEAGVGGVTADNNTSTDLANARAIIDLDPGEEVTCTFRNRQNGVTIVKELGLDDPTQTFGFRTDLLGSTGGLFTLTPPEGGQASRFFGGLPAGTYTINENIPEGWDLTSLECVDPGNETTRDLDSASANIQLNDGELITCTFHNEPAQSSITIKKIITRGDAEGVEFPFEFEGDTIETFTLTSADSEVTFPAEPGFYRIRELIPEGWELLRITCTDPTGGTVIGFPLPRNTVVVDLDPGDLVECTFENSPDTLITIKKVITRGDAEGVEFPFESELGTFTLTSADPEVTFPAEPGFYPIRELVPEGWTLLSITCTDPNDNTNILHPTVRGAVTINLDPGELVECTFTNTFEADSDPDGIPDDVEDGAPNDGDGNNDGTPDSQQARVASLPGASGDYITVEAPEGTTLKNVQIVPNPSPGDAPSASFPFGFLDFELDGLPPGGSAIVNLILPPSPILNTYWRYGPTLANTSDHWYEWLFDGATRAQISHQPGQTLVALHYTDGGRGDDDLTANGTIVDPGAPGTYICTIEGTDGDDDLRGTSGDDVICGYGGDDEIRGRGGNDVILAGRGDDEIRGGRGDDIIRGGRGEDEIKGGSGNDWIEGEGGEDELEGNGGRDQLFGGAEDDELDGGRGRDYLDGGPGEDECRNGETLVSCEDD